MLCNKLTCYITCCGKVIKKSAKQTEQIYKVINNWQILRGFILSYITNLGLKDFMVPYSQTVGHTDFCHKSLEPALSSKYKSFDDQEPQAYHTQEKYANVRFLLLKFCFLFIYGVQQDPYIMHIQLFIITDVSWPFKAGSNGVQPKSVGLAVWRLATLKVMQARLSCSLVYSPLNSTCFYDFVE